MNIAEIAKQMVKQDCSGTSHPMFCVQALSRTYGRSFDSPEGYTWYDDEWSEVRGSKRYLLESGRKAADGYTRLEYVEHWKTVTTCLTRKAANMFKAQQAHNFDKLRVYVESGHNNPEWKALRAHFLSLVTP